MKKNYLLFKKAKTIVEWKNWTPITPIEGTQKGGKRTTFTIHRTQFPLVESEAISCHKSQGQSFQNVCLSICSSMQNSCIYVGMSRARTLNGLYLCYLDQNRTSILPKEYQHMSFEEREKIAKKKMLANSNYLELQRMRRTWPVRNYYEKILPMDLDNNKEQKSSDESVMIFVQNCRFNVITRNKLENDYAIGNRQRRSKIDLLMMVETHAHINYIDSVYLQGYETIFKSCTTRENGSNGQVCFANSTTMKEMNKKKCELVAHNADGERSSYSETDISEFSLYKISNERGKHFYVCLVYRHPKKNKYDFFREMKAFLHKHLGEPLSNQRLFVVGDFNIDFRKEKYKDMLAEIKRKLYLQPIDVHKDKYGEETKSSFHSYDSPQHTHSKIDWIFRTTTTCEPCPLETVIRPDYDNEYQTNGINIRYCQYETWWSDHRPLLFEVQFNKIV